MRQDLLARQVDTLRAILPNQVMDTLPMKIAVMMGHLFLTPPQFAEVGNYLAQTASSESVYLAVPLHRLFRGNLWGGMMLVFAFFGVFLGVSRIIKTSDDLQRRKLTLLGLATLLQAIAMLIAIPLPFQRYYIPLVPFISLWTAIGLAELSTVKIKQTT